MYTKDSAYSICQQLCSRCPVTFEYCPDPCTEIAFARSMPVEELKDICCRCAGNLNKILAEIRQCEENCNG